MVVRKFLLRLRLAVISLEVESFNTIGNVKEKIQGKENTSVSTEVGLSKEAT